MLCNTLLVPAEYSECGQVPQMAVVASAPNQLGDWFESYAHTSANVHVYILELNFWTVGI